MTAGHKRLRGALLGAGLLSGVMLQAPAATADPLQRILEVVTNVSCGLDTAEGASFVFEAANNNRFGSTVEALVEEPTFEIVLVGSSDGAWTATTFDLAIPLVSTETGEPAGEALVTGTYAPSSEPRVEQVRHRDGNAWTTGTTTTTDLVVDITSATVPGYTVLPGTADCNAFVTALDFEITDPSATVIRAAELQSDACDLVGMPGAMVDMRGDFHDLVFRVPGIGEGSARGTVPLRAGAGSVTVDVLDDEGAKLTEATVSVALRRAGPAEQESFRERGLFFTAEVTPYVIAVDVTTADGRSGSTDCPAFYVTERLLDTPPGDDGGR